MGSQKNAAKTYTLSDTSEDTFNMVSVGTSGTLVIDMKDGTSNTITAAPAGVWIPVGEALRIRTTSAAGDILVAQI